MDIKEIAEQVSKRIYVEDGLLLSKFISEKFAEALIESYKAELLKEVGEPVAWLCWLDGDTDLLLRDAALVRYEPLAYRNRRPLYTSDQVAAAIIKATKPLEEEIERLKGMVSEIQAARHVHQEHNRLLTQLAAAQEEIDQARRTAEYWKAEHLAANNQLAKAEQRYLAWEGGEEWEQLAFQLCADECGEESCNELIWEGCPPEPWGDRWLKYESEAKRIIQLVRQYAPDKKAEQQAKELSDSVAQKVAEACSRTAYVQVKWFGYNTHAEAVREAIRDGEWRKFVKEV